MNEITNILNSSNHGEKAMIIDALLESCYGDEAMSVFVENNNLDGVLENLNREDLYCMHKTFFQEIKTRKDVLDFEEDIKNMDNSFDECPYPLFHSFADGMYTREIHFNKGDLIVGAIHKNEYFVNVLKGRIWVVSEFGAKEIIAPASFTAKAGVKHIGFTLEDTVWSDTHKVNSDNVEDAEKEIFVDSYEELDSYNNILGFSNMCKDIDMTEIEIRQLSVNEDDLIEQPENDAYVGDSDIEGKGLFAGKDFKKGDIIALARKDNHRTPAGRYSNHSDSPNSKAITEDGKGFFSAIKDIKDGDEITINYRDAREKAKLLDGEILCQAG